MDVPFSNLPGFPLLWNDFAAGSGLAAEIVDVAPSREELKARLGRAPSGGAGREAICSILRSQCRTFAAPQGALELIDQAARPDTALVIVYLPGSYFGGTLRTYLTLLGTARLAADLAGEGTRVLPLAVVEDAPRGSSVAVLDANAHLFHVDLPPPGAGETVPPGVGESIRVLEDALSGETDWSVAVKGAYAPGERIAAATVRFFTSLPGFPPFLFLDAGDEVLRGVLNRADGEAGSLHAEIQDAGKRLEGKGFGCAARDDMARRASLRISLGRMLPAAAQVVGTRDLCLMAHLGEAFARRGVPFPLLWPRVSATVLEPRSPKIMDKYGIRFEELFSDRSGMQRRLADPDEDRRVLEEIAGLGRRVGVGMSTLKHIAAADAKIGKAVEDAQTRIQYQVDRMSEKYAAASDVRSEALGRQLERLCNLLAPGGDLQERRMSGLYFLHRYASAFIPALSGRLDPFRFRHQLLVLE